MSNPDLLSMIQSRVALPEGLFFPQAPSKSDHCPCFPRTLRFAGCEDAVVRWQILLLLVYPSVFFPGFTDRGSILDAVFSIFQGNAPSLSGGFFFHGRPQEVTQQEFSPLFLLGSVSCLMVRSPVLLFLKLAFPLPP